MDTTLTRLPLRLTEELAEGGGGGGARFRLKEGNSRKAARKAAKEEAKARKRSHNDARLSRRKEVLGKRIRPEDVKPKRRSKKQRDRDRRWEAAKGTSTDEEPAKRAKIDEKAITEADTPKPKKSKQSAKLPAKESTAKPEKMRTKEVYDPDAERAAELARKLRGKGGGRIMSEFEADGWGDLLESLDLGDLKGAAASLDGEEGLSGEESSGEEFDGEEEEEEEEEGGESDTGERITDLYGQEGSDEGEDEGFEEEDSEMEQAIDIAEAEGVGEEEEEGEDEEDEEEEGEGEEGEGKQPLNPGASETPITYVPPHLRKAKTIESEAAPELVRGIKGLLNRLSDRNLHYTTGEFQSLFSQYPAAHVVQTLTNTILSLVCRPGVGMCPVTDVYAALITALSQLVGVSVLARLLEEWTPKYMEYLAEARGDEACNALVLLTSIYSLKALHCDLLFDIGQMHADSMGELDLELLLVLIRHCGPRLRSDDPAALKTLILTINSNAGKARQTSSGNAVRIDFMLEALADLKNNRMKGLEAANDKIQRLRKELRQVCQTDKIQEVRVRWATLNNPKARGRWWIVGDTDRQERKEAFVLPDTSEESKALLRMAQRLRINTETRRAVFFAVMSSQDYSDAFEKVVRLGLKGEQEREIVRVIVHCAVNSRRFNPFFEHLLTQLCQMAPSHRYTLQYTLWDKIRAIASATPTQVTNMAELTAAMVLNNTFSLTLLKVFEVHNMSSQAILALQLIFRRVLSVSEDDVATILQKVDEAQGTELVADSLSIFLKSHFITEKANKKDAVLMSNAQRAIRLLDRRSVAIQ